MKFDTRAKVWEAASKDKARPVLTHVHLLVEEDGKGWLEATDSCLLVRVPCETAKGDVSGFLPIEALKAAAKDADGELVCNGSCSLPDGRSWPRPDDGTFPDAARIIAGHSPNEGSYSGSAAEFGVSPALLVRAEKALGARGLRVIVKSPLKPITIVGMGGVAGAECVVMPIRLAV